MDSETKKCQNCKKEFVIKSEDFSFYDKIKVPLPTFCPECRTIRRFLFKNDRSLYKRKCNAPGHTEEIISMYPERDDINVCDKDYWWSDEWDPFDYGVEYDFSKPFFEQFYSLQCRVPRPSLINNKAINSDYCNFADENKNCYLLTSANRCEDSFFGFFLVEDKNISDCIYCTESELLYECIDCQKCFNLRYGQECRDCVDSTFLFDCRGCNNCLFCVNLRNKSYYIFNKPSTKEEYEKKIKEIFKSYSSLKRAIEEFEKIKIESSIHKSNNIIASKNVSGDVIFQSKNINNGFDIYDSENSSYVQGGLKGKECYDLTSFEKAESCYESISIGLTTYNCYFTVFCRDSHSLSYCDNCRGSRNLFGCVSLRSKEYCILNKQYTKEEYEELVPKIIKHMNDMPYVDKKGLSYGYGEFFPSELSPFGYNETIAVDYFPKTKDEVLQEGYFWRDRKERNYHIDIKNENLPENTDENILNKTIECAHKSKCSEQCTRAFKIIPNELKFYQRMNIPLPRLCPNCRHYQRLAKRNPMKLWHRSCMCQKVNHNHEGKCLNEFETSYAPDRQETIYCESCYQKEIY